MTSNYEKYNSENPLQQFLIQKFLTNLLALIKTVPKGKLLEVGSGEGYVLEQILSRTKFSATALDVNPEALKILKKRLPEVKNVQGYAENLPFAKDEFDLVVCCEVLEHLKDPKMALKELKRVGKKYFLFSVPDEPWFSSANFLRGKNLKLWGSDPEHLQKWSFGQFLKFVQSELVILEARRSFPWTIVLAKK